MKLMKKNLRPLVVGDENTIIETKIALTENICENTIKRNHRHKYWDNKLSYLIGKRFDKLVIIRRVESRAKYSMWECQCDCGNIKIAKSKNLLSGDCKSCGCKRKSKYEEIPGSYFGSIKENAKNRNLEYSLSPEYLWNLYIKQNRKCVLSGVNIIFHVDMRHGKQTASLDRIDSSKGYIDGNVQWVHKSVNKMKMDMNQDEFLEWVNKISYVSK